MSYRSEIARLTAELEECREECFVRRKLIEKHNASLTDLAAHKYAIQIPPELEIEVDVQFIRDALKGDWNEP